jgi:hypothetical protein
LKKSPSPPLRLAIGAAKQQLLAQNNSRKHKASIKGGKATTKTTAPPLPPQKLRNKTGAKKTILQKLKKGNGTTD